MKLREWLDDEGVTVADFKDRIGVKSKVTVYRYINGDQIPEREIMESIFIATGWAVTPNDFYDLTPSSANETGAE